MAERRGRSAAEFGTALKGFLEQAVQGAAAPEPVFARVIRTHFDAEPAALPIVSQQFEASDHPNVQVALDAATGDKGCTVQLLGSGQRIQAGVAAVPNYQVPAEVRSCPGVRAS